jgi:hypothetical protein
MPNIRVMPPASGSTTCTANGRSYSCAVGSFLDVPDFDALVLLANGWTSPAGGLEVGTTASRPAKPKKNQAFHDSTLGYVIHFDGANWRNPNTGAIV